MGGATVVYIQPRTAFMYQRVQQVGFYFPNSSDSNSLAQDNPRSRLRVGSHSAYFTYKPKG